MHVNFDRKKKLLRAEFVGQDVVALVNYLKPFRNNAPVGEWLRILEPLCAPVVEGPHVCRFVPLQGDFPAPREKCSCGVVRVLDEIEEAMDEEEQEAVPPETVEADELGETWGRSSSDDEISEKFKRLPQVTGHTPQELDVICRNCGIAQWRHIPGSNRCQVNGVPLGTYFRPPLMLEAVKPYCKHGVPWSASCYSTDHTNKICHHANEREVEDDDGAKFARTVGEDEVRCS